MRSGVFEGHVYLTTDSAELISRIRIDVGLKSTGWVCEVELSLDDTGCAFTIDAATGRLMYVSSDVVGNNYAGFITGTFRRNDNA
jgi:hypothetical protein